MTDCSRGSCTQMGSPHHLAMPRANGSLEPVQRTSADHLCVGKPGCAIQRPGLSTYALGIAETTLLSNLQRTLLRIH